MGRFCSFHFGVSELVRAGAVPGGTLNNIDYFSPRVLEEKPVSDVIKTLLFDAQTSGGLLIALPNQQAGQLLAGLHSSGIIAAACIGEIVKKGAGVITVKNKKAI